MERQAAKETAWIIWIGVAACVALTGLVWLGGGIPASVPKLPDEGALWYYWKLPNPTFASRLSAWGGYLLHQCTIWGCIWWAQRHKQRYTTTLNPLNWLMLGLNLAFIGLHFLQTYIWYDGLAQDTSILSSQGSVILLLVFVLIMETPRRGLFFGKPVPFRQEFVRGIKKYHGYFFAWAAIYTFWYHPMEATPGHLVGFFYMFLLIFQSSLIFNRAHLNRWWTFALEFTVLPHGALVAWYQGKGMWPMFLFGFGGILLVTQLHGLSLRRWSKWLVYAGFALAIALTYGLTSRGFGKLDEIIRIPVIDYLLVLVIYLIFLLFFWLNRGWHKLRGTSLSGPEAGV